MRTSEWPKPLNQNDREEVVFRLAVISRDVELSSNNDFESTLFQVFFATLFHL